MTDIIQLLRPRTVLLGSMAAAGRWGVRLPQQPGPIFYFVTKGRCLFRPEGGETLELHEGDYVLSARPSDDAFFSDPDAEITTSDDEFKAKHTVDGEVRLGDPTATPTMRGLGGLILCDPANAELLTGLLPRFICVRAAEETGARLRAIVAIIREEVNDERPGRDAILSRLVEVMLIETLRREATTSLPPVSVLGGLADPQLAKALSNIHADVSRSWTVAELAKHAGMSRSVFARRFSEAVGSAPVEYLLQWRMARAKDALLHGRGTIEEIAASVGYKSASAFSTAFSHRLGCPPSDYASLLRAHATLS